MSKKKKKKSTSILGEIDAKLYESYDKIIEEVQLMQMKVSSADQIARKKAKKLAKKKKNQSYYYNFDTERKKIRNEIINEMESNNFLDRMFHILEQVAPVIILIGRLVASLILSILSMDIVKIHMKPEVLEKMQIVFARAMAIS